MMSDMKWKLVPVEPTEEMIDAGCELEPVTRYGSRGEVLRERYKAMLDAAPAASAQKGLSDDRIAEWCSGFSIANDLDSRTAHRLDYALRALLREAEGP